MIGYQLSGGMLRRTSGIEPMFAENPASEFKRLGMDDLRQNIMYADIRLDMTAMLVVDHEDFRIH